jgi:branched-chain amino acid transport system permease protein
VQLTVNYIDQILVLSAFAFSLNLVLGYAGIFTAAHAAFGAIGGYALIWLTTAHGFSFIPAMLVGLGVAGLFGLLIGYAALRLEMLWLLLLTLAVQLVLVGVLTNISTFGGSTGVEATSLTIFGHQLVEPTQAFPLVAAGAVVVGLLCFRIGESPYGRVLRGIREDEIATRSLGKNVFFYKVSIFTITAVMAGFGGVLLSAQTSLANPTLFGFTVSVEVIAMVMIGGRGNMFGTLVGVVLVVLATPFFENVIHLSTNVSALAQQLAYGLLLVLVIYFRPQGLIPEGTSLANWWHAILRVPAHVSAVLRRSPQHAGAVVAPAGEVSADLVSVSGASGGTAGAAFPPDGVGQHASQVGRGADAAPSRDGRGGGGDVIVEVHGLSKSFGGLRAVDGLNMQLRRGVITALVGPNGAGKTTVFNLLTGALPVDAGRVYLYGEDVTGMRPDIITRRGMVRSFQDVRIFGALSVIDNVMLGVQNHVGEKLVNIFAHPVQTARAEKASRERAYEWLRFIEMEHLANVKAGALGFGQQKLVALARILATESDVLLLDEPGSGIDHAWINEMIDVIRHVRDADRTVCIVEHNLEVVGKLADHVYFMELGCVTAEGSFEDLTSDPRLTEAYFGAI